MNRASLIWLFIVFLAANRLVAQTNQETRDLAAFNGVKVSNAIEATFVKGDKHQIEIIASGIELSRVESKVTNRVLELRISGSNPRSSTIKATITYAELEEINASTSAKAFVQDPIEARLTKISAATSGYVEAEVKSQELIVDAQTNAKIYVKGKVDKLDFSAFTNAEIDGEGLEAQHAEVKINTNAKGSFHVSESLRGSAATRGRVTYTGDPKIVDIKTNTGGSIEEK